MQALHFYNKLHISVCDIHHFKASDVSKDFLFSVSEHCRIRSIIYTFVRFWIHLFSCLKRSDTWLDRIRRCCQTDFTPSAAKVPQLKVLRSQGCCTSEMSCDVNERLIVCTAVQRMRSPQCTREHGVLAAFTARDLEM